MMGPQYTEIEAYTRLAAQTRAHREIETRAAHLQWPQPQAATRSIPSLRLIVGERLIRFGAWIAGYPAAARHRPFPMWGFLS